MLEFSNEALAFVKDLVF